MALREALCALLLPGPSYGYQLQATLQAELGPLWETRQSQLYLTVGRMQRDGLLVVRRQRQDGLPDRQLLELTAAGRDTAHQWLDEPGGGGDLVVALAVARLVAPERFEEMCGAAVERRQAELHELRTLRRGAVEGFQPEALDHEIRRVEAELRWASAVRDATAAVVERPQARRRRRAAEERPA